MKRSCVVIVAIAVLVCVSPASAQNWEVDLLSGTQVPVGDLASFTDAGVAVSLAVNRRLSDRIWLRVPVTGAGFPGEVSRRGPPDIQQYRAVPGVDYQLVPADGRRWGLRVGGGLGATYATSDPVSMRLPTLTSEGLSPADLHVTRELDNLFVTLRLGARAAYDLTSRLAVTGGVAWTHAFAGPEESTFLRAVDEEPLGGLSSFPLMGGLRLKF